MQKRNAIWISTYPKSGNTWVHSVLRIAGRRYGFPQVDMDVYNILAQGNTPEICPAVCDSLSVRPCVVLKTEAIYKAGDQLHSFPGLELVNTAFIHIYRNPLDLLLSYINYTRLEYGFHAGDAVYRRQLFQELLGLGEQYPCGAWKHMTLETIPRRCLDHALDCFSDNDLALPTLQVMHGSWKENVQSWLAAADDMPGHVIRYEDCLEDPGQFVRLCDLFKFGEADVLRALDAVNSWARAKLTDGTEQHAIFYNKMRAYYFTQYFSRGGIHRFFERNEAVLRMLGYSSILEMV